MHYYVDGYNLMFRVQGTGDDIKEQRQRLIRELAVKVRFLDLQVTLVFDAQYQYQEAQTLYYHNLAVAFTAEGETADEYILQALREASDPSEHTVVTSDKKLAWYARRKHAKTESIDEFLGWLNRRYKNKLRRNKQAKQERTPAKVTAKSSEIRTLSSNPEECFDYYLSEFEKRLDELETPSKPSKPKRDTRTDFERWLDAFSR